MKKNKIEEIVSAVDIKKLTDNLRNTANLIDYLIEEGFSVKDKEYYSDTLVFRRENDSLFVKIKSPKFLTEVSSSTFSVALVKNYLTVFLCQPSINSFMSVLGMISDFPDESEYHVSLFYDETIDSLVYNYSMYHKIPIIRPHQAWFFSDTKRDIEAIKFNRFDYNKLLVNKIQYNQKVYSIPELICKLEEEDLLE